MCAVRSVWLHDTIARLPSGPDLQYNKPDKNPDRLALASLTISGASVAHIAAFRTGVRDGPYGLVWLLAEKAAQSARPDLGGTGAAGQLLARSDPEDRG